MKGLHGNKLACKCTAEITFKDGGQEICELKLDNGAWFTLSDMRKMTKSNTLRPIESLIFTKSTVHSEIKGGSPPPWAAPVFEDAQGAFERD